MCTTNNKIFINLSCVEEEFYVLSIVANGVEGDRQILYGWTALLYLFVGERRENILKSTIHFNTYFIHMYAVKSVIYDNPLVLVILIVNDTWS